MFPLKTKRLGGYKHGQWTFYGKKHKGTDWKAYYQELYAPTDGRIVSTPSDRGGGLWVNFRDSNGYLHQFAHMKTVRPRGTYKEGAVIGITGNSGLWTTGPHLHHQIKKGFTYYDPEKFNYGGLTMSQYNELMNHINALRKDVNGLSVNNADRANEIQILLKQVKAWDKEIKGMIDGTNKTMESWNRDRQKENQIQSKQIKEINKNIADIKKAIKDVGILSIEEEKTLKTLLNSFQGLIEKVINFLKGSKGK